MTTYISKPRIYVDAIPEKIVAHEQYTYKVDISANDYEFINAEAGIELEIPYDGDLCFSKTAISSVKETYLPFKQHENVNGFIGNLAIGAPYNWETDLRRPAKPEIYPIEIPLQTGTFTQDLWDSDEWRVKVTQPYQPNDLHFPPVDVEVQLFDDYISSPRISFENFLQQRLQNNALEGAMVFDFVIRVPLPLMVEREGVSILLEVLELKWPSIAAPWQMKWVAIEEKGGKEIITGQPWRYDTTRGAIVLENIPTVRKDDDPQSPLVHYTCHLQMLMMLPGLFVPEESGEIKSELQGEVKVQITNLLLSGREIAWMTTDGYLSRKTPPKIVQQTEIRAGFSAELSERFTNRPLTTYRQWIFPGVNLTEARASDVAAVLQDLGYRLKDLGKGDTIILTLKGETVDTAQLTAEKISQMIERDEQAKLKIEVLLRRCATGTTARERELKGIVVSTDLPTSDLMVQLRGSIEIAGSLLDQDLAQLMSLLSKRFINVADLR